MDLAAISDLADIEPVLEDMGERTNHEPACLNRFSIGKAPRLRPDALSLKAGSQFADRTEPEIVAKYLPDEVGLLRDDFQLLIDAAIAERDRTADPDSLALGFYPEPVH